MFAPIVRDWARTRCFKSLVNLSVHAARSDLAARDHETDDSTSAPCIPPVLPDPSDHLPRGFAPSTFLMPLSFACIMGGLLTTIGTSTNLGLFAPPSALPALPGSICLSSDAHASSAGTSMRPWMVCRCFRGWSASSHESTSQWREARPRKGSETPKRCTDTASLPWSGSHGRPPPVCSAQRRTIVACAVVNSGAPRSCAVAMCRGHVLVPRR
jgi:hypothetical protein